jgi:hypothetical protein
MKKRLIKHLTKELEKSKIIINSLIQEKNELRKIVNELNIKHNDD